MREPRFYEEPACAEIGGDLFFPERFEQPFGNIEINMARKSAYLVPIVSSVLSGESIKKYTESGAVLLKQIAD